MDQDLQENVTQPQWNTGPTRSHKGYVGSNEHFGVKLNVIKIKNSDAVSWHVPSEQQQRRTTDDQERFSQYIQQKIGDSVYQDWMNKMGPYLADWALRLPRNENPPWKLLRFPENYTLWVHKSGVESDRGNPRHDAYLYGAPHLGPRTSRTPLFRSPMEFVPHAIWLMRGCAGQCDCKYCIPGQTQNEINRRLNHGADTGDSDDGINHANAGPSRRRSGMARTRRIRRDRSAPINLNIARDYRVGVTDPGPSSC